MNLPSKESLAKRLQIDPAKLEEYLAKTNQLEECPPGFPSRILKPCGVELSEMLFSAMQITPWRTCEQDQVVTHVHGTLTLFLWDFERVYEYDLGDDSTEDEILQIIIPAGIQHCFISKTDSKLTVVAPAT